MRYINYSIILTLMLLLVLLCESTQGLRFFNFPVCFCFSSKYRQGRKIFEYVIEWSKSRVKIEVTCLDAINTILALEYLKCSEWHHDSDTLSLSGTTWPCCLLELSDIIILIESAFRKFCPCWISVINRRKNKFFGIRPGDRGDISTNLQEQILFWR